MTERERLKQRLVATAIQENVDLIERRWPRTALPRRVRSRLLLIGGVAGLFALTASGAVFYSERFFSQAAPGDVATPRAAQTALAPTGSGSRSLLQDFADSEREPAAPADPPKLSVDAPQRFRVPGASGRGVLPLKVRRVVLDPGHGGTSRGTSADGLSEKEITLDVARRLRELLREQDIEVAMTREADRTLELDDRVRLANEFRGDLFISIHVNWLETRERGIETFYLGTTDDPRLNALASHENRDSGYSLTDFRKLLEGIYADVRGEESRRLAEAVQHALYGELRDVSPSLVDRGVKTAPFVVLIGTQMPAILAEVSCLSNETEVKLLRQPAYRQRIANALARGVLGYAEALAPSEPPPARTELSASPHRNERDATPLDGYSSRARNSNGAATDA